MLNAGYVLMWFVCVCFFYPCCS